MVQTRGTLQVQQRVRCKRRRDAKRRESVEEVVGKGESPLGEEKKGRANGNAPHQEGGQEAPCHCVWQRSGVTTGDRKVLRMREHASLGARREGTSQNQATRSTASGPGGRNCAVKLLTQEAETSLILKRPRAAKVTP